MDVDSAALANGRFETDRALGASTLREAVDMIEAFDGAGAGRITGIHAPHAGDTCSIELLEEVARLADTDGRQVHTHLAQSPLELKHIKARNDCGPVRLLAQAGLLHDKLFAAHCIFLDEPEIAELGRAQAKVCHAPLGNAAFGALAPAQALHNAGATLTLCTDTKSADMFESMRMALAAARIRAEGQFVFDADVMLSWATCDAARALGMANVGRLQPGYRADLVILDAAAANLRPLVDGTGIVVHSGSANNVQHVFVDGEHLVADGRRHAWTPRKLSTLHSQSLTIYGPGQSKLRYEMTDECDQSNENIQRVSTAIQRAWLSGHAISSKSLPTLTTPAQAYAVQRQVADNLNWIGSPGERRHWKVGGPRADATPTAACLPDALIYQSGCRMSLTLPGLVGVESEVAFRVSDVQWSADGVIVVVDACCVAIEVVASRFSDVGAVGPWLKLADQQMNAALVLGPWQPLPDVIWDSFICSATLDGTELAQSNDGHPCKDPLWALNWLANHAKKRHLPLRTGDVVTTGSWLGILAIDRPGVLVTSFSGLGEASIQFGGSLD